MIKWFIVILIIISTSSCAHYIKTNDQPDWVLSVPFQFTDVTYGTYDIDSIADSIKVYSFSESELINLFKEYLKKFFPTDTIIEDFQINETLLEFNIHNMQNIILKDENRWEWLQLYFSFFITDTSSNITFYFCGNYTSGLGSEPIKSQYEYSLEDKYNLFYYFTKDFISEFNKYVGGIYNDE